MSTNLRSNLGDYFGPGKLPELEATILAKAESYPSMIPILYNLETTDTDIYQTTTLSGLQNPSLKNEGAPVSFQALQPGYDNTITVDTYATGYRISKEMVRDGKFNYIQRATESFAKGQYEVKEIAAASLLTGGFTDTGPDGVSLFNTAHPLENSGATGSNLGTAAALSITSFRALRNIMQDTVNEQGQRVVYSMAYLVVGQALQDTAKEIVKSMYNPENANNAINTVYESVQLLPGGYWNYLNSDTNFFIISQKNEHSLTWLDRQPLEVTSDYDKHAFAHEIIGDTRWARDYGSWRGVVGNAGA